MARHSSGTPTRAAAAVLGSVLMTLSVACGSGADDNDGAGSSDGSRSRDGAADEAAGVDERPAATGADDAAASADGSQGMSSGEMSPAATRPESEVPASASDESPVPPGTSAGGAGVPPVARAQFASCTRSVGSYEGNCDYVYVTMTESAPPRCVQLTIDNCTGDGYGRRGLPVDLPLRWQLSAASIGDSPDECELGVFYPEAAVVVDASGSIEFEPVEGSELPTDIVLDVSLLPSRSAADATAVDVVTPEPLAPVRCAN